MTSTTELPAGFAGAPGKKDYLAFELAHKPSEEVAHYVTWDVCESRWLPRLNRADAAGALQDKLAWDRVARRAGLAPPEVVAVHDGATTDLSALQAVLAERAPAGVVIKPAAGHQGRGVVVFASLDTDGRGGTTVRGTKRTIGSAVRRACGAPGGGRLIVQELLRQHAELDDYAPQPLSTVRVVTLRRRDGSVRVLGAFLRLGRAGAMTDNCSTGGIAVDVDVATGLLRDGVRVAGGVVHRMHQHPDSGTPFLGRQLPLWPQVVDLCVAAAGLFEPVRLIGWDVMATDDGPRLVEGNADIRLRTLQAARGSGLLDGALRADLAELGV